MAPKKTASRASSRRSPAAPQPEASPAPSRAAEPAAGASTTAPASLAAAAKPDPGTPEATVAEIAATRGMFSPGQKIKVVAVRVGFDGLKRRYPADHGHKDSGKPFLLTIGRDGSLPSWVEVAEGKPVRPKPPVLEEGAEAEDEEGNVI